MIRANLFPLTRRDWLLALLVAAVVAAVYAPMVRYDFADYDDSMYVYANDNVLGGPTPNGLLWAFTSIYAGNWHPLTWVSLQFDAMLWGENPGGYHLTNLLLHAANSALFYLVLAAMTGMRGRSLVAAALWGLHPLHVESVAWITERKDVLSGFFWLLTIAAYLRYAVAPSWGRILPVLGVFALGLMAKPMLVTLPFVLLLLDAWPLMRLPAWSRLGDCFFEKTFLFVLVVGSCAATFYAQSFGGAVRPSHEITWESRIEGTAVAYVVYLRKTLWPDDLTCLYPLPTTARPIWQPLGALLLLLAITAGSLYLRRSAPYLLVGWLWYLGTLIPVIGLVQVGEQAYADRYTYIPQMGLFIAVVWGLAALADLAHVPFWLRSVTVAGILAAFAWQTVQQHGYWRNRETLWLHAIDVMPDDPAIITKLGRCYGGMHRWTESLQTLDRALELDPDYFEAIKTRAAVTRFCLLDTAPGVGKRIALDAKRAVMRFRGK